MWGSFCGKLSIGAVADLPCRMPAQKSATVWPIGLTTPIPVTTTRRPAPASAIWILLPPGKVEIVFEQRSASKVGVCSPGRKPRVRL